MSNKTLLIIAFVWPEPASTAAGNRMLQLIHFFLAQNYKITVASTAAESKLSLDLARFDIEKVPIQLNHSSFDDFVSELQPDTVLFDRFLTEEQFGWRVAKFAPNALRILDTEDLHSLRKTREKSFKSGLEFSVDEWLQNDTTKREIASIYRSDISLIISSYEMQLLKEEISISEALLMHLPFMVTPLSQVEIAELKPYEKRKDFICIGNGKHAPNVDAIVWLKKEIWPLLRRELPDAKLHIYGAYLPEHIQQMHNPKERFFVHGWAADLKSVVESAKINLVPLRFGAGLKGKLLDAMRYGTPSISTSIGAESMHGHMDFGGMIADSTEDFVEAAVELYMHHTFWQTKQDDGFDIIEILYDNVKWSEKLALQLKSVQNNLKTHRAQNFIGTLLQHETMQSSKYMAKWIEAKREG